LNSFSQEKFILVIFMGLELLVGLVFIFF